MNRKISRTIQAISFRKKLGIFEQYEQPNLMKNSEIVYLNNS